MDPAEDDQQDLPSPTIGPVGFALGVVVILVGLIVNPLWISTIGLVITVVFGFIWARAATRELRSSHVDVEPEVRKATDGELDGCRHRRGDAHRLRGALSRAASSSRRRPSASAP